MTKELCKLCKRALCYTNRDLLTAVYIRAAMGALARWHAFFWLPSEAGEAGEAGRGAECSEVEQLAANLWSVGSYWDLGKQPDGQLDNLVPSWRRIVAVMRQEGLMAEEEEEEWIAIGDKFARVSAEADRLLHGGGSVARNGCQGGGGGGKGSAGCGVDAVERGGGTSHPLSKQTIIHGDPKAANFFFKAQPTILPAKRPLSAPNAGAADGSWAATDGGEEEELLGPAPSVGIIDFQWTGKGIAATDVAYLVIAAASPAALFADAGAYEAFSSSVASSPREGSQDRENDALRALDRADIDDSEEHVLRHYYSCLESALRSEQTGRAGGRGGGVSGGGVAGGGEWSKADIPDYDEFVRQYRWAFIDQCRAVVACFWDVPGNRLRHEERQTDRQTKTDRQTDKSSSSQAAVSPSIVQMLRTRQADLSMTFNASNKHLPLACWILRRLRHYLAAL